MRTPAGLRAGDRRLRHGGAVSERFFRGVGGVLLAFEMMLVCTVVPLLVGFRWFRRKDF